MTTKLIMFTETIPTNLWILQLLNAFRLMGNAHDNEILSIIEEFREASLIIN